MKSLIYKCRLLPYLRDLILLCLVIVVLLKPAGILFVGSTDVKCKLYSDFEKTEPTEKELNKGFEQGEQSLFYTDLVEEALDSYSSTDCSNLHENTLDFNPSIHLPPPKYSMFIHNMSFGGIYKFHLLL